MPPSITYGRQRQKYERRGQLCTYLTGGLGGVALLGAGDVANGLFLEVHPVLRAGFFTLVIVTGGLLGLAYTGFSWAKTVLDRLVEDGTVSDSATYDRTKYPPPRQADMLYRIATILVATTALWLMTTAWIGAAVAHH